ncbi:MAG: hypothetical protein WCT50_02210 [Patescibacteria group bacterium]
MLEAIKKIKFVYVFWVFFYLLLFIILVKGGFSNLDPDFGWHLKVGQEIATTYQIPQLNTYNYTYHGNWVDHEWLSNLAIYYIYDHYGYAALVNIFAGLIILILVILNFYVSQVLKDRANFWLIASFQLFGVLAAIPHFGVRIQELALLFVLLVLIIIDHYSRSKNWRVLLFLPPLFFLWANLHASFLIGFFIIFSWIGIKLFEKIITKNGELKQLSSFSLFALLSLIVTGLTPYRLELYNFLLGYKNKAYLSLIKEWLPQSSFPFRYDQLIYLALGAVALILYVYFRLQKRQKLNIWEIFLSFVFLVLSLKSRRHFPLFFVVSFSLMIDIFSPFFKEIKVAYYNWLKYLVVFCGCLIAIVQFSATHFTQTPFSSFCYNYPCEAIDFLKNNSQYNDDKILNNYDWGGFMIWAIPERKLFIDGRLPQVEFANWTLIQEYYNFFSAGNNQSEKLDEYNIKLILMSAEDKQITAKKWEKIFFGIKDSDLRAVNHLRKYLDDENGWEVIYQDKVAKIYFRN